MKLWTTFWNDDRGFVLSAEAVLVGTVAILGATVGLKMASTAINEELKEVAFAFRSLDQSYTVLETRSCGAWTAGSCYRQQDVETSLAELCAVAEQAEGELPRSGDRPEYLPEPPQHIPPAPPVPMPFDDNENEPIEDASARAEQGRVARGNQLAI